MDECPCDYDYDDTYQLSSESGVTQQNFVNDSLFNHVEKNGVSQTINALNQLENDGKTTYQYDRRGYLWFRRQEEKEEEFVYDALGRLISVKCGDEQVHYRYDGLNRRMSKDKERYLYAMQNEVGAVDEEGNIRQYRVLGLGRGAEIGAAVLIELNGGVYIPIHDHNGNVACLANEQGEVVETYRYSAYGTEQIFDQSGSEIDSSMNPWRYSSKRKDAETGFIYFGERYYNPETSLWITPDPLSREGGPNLYAYVLHNPITCWDTYGHMATSLAWMVNTSNNFESLLGMPSEFQQNTSLYSPVVYLDMETFCQNKSRNANLGLSEHPKFQIGFSNGIDNSFAEATNSANEMALNSAMSLAKTHDLELVGFGVLSHKYIEEVTVSFKTKKMLNKEEARQIVVDCVSMILKQINSDIELEPYLIKYPLTIKEINLTIYVRDSQNHRVWDPNIGVIDTGSGKIAYRTVAKDNIYQYKSQEFETYEEAQAKTADFRE